MTTVDVDRLPSSQYLILEVLAARFRLGEEWWPFPTRLGRALRALGEAGLISTQSGNTPYTTRACLTDAGRAKMFGSGYTSPVDRLLAQIAELQAEVPHLIRMEPDCDADGQYYRVEVRRGPRLIQAMAEALWGWLRDQRATNYTETHLTDGEGGKFVLIVVRPDGKTPHELRRQAEAELAEARQLLAAGSAA